MRSLFTSITSTLQRDSGIVKDFIQHHAEFLHPKIACEHWVPDVPTQEMLQEKKVTTYTVSQSECELLQKKLLHQATLIPGESEQSWFGRIAYEGRVIGFYLGKGYEYNAYWARFWLD